MIIRNEREYQEALRRFKMDHEVNEQQRHAFAAAGLTPDQIDTAMEPLLSFQAKLSEEITWYENVQQQNFTPTKRLTDMGRLLIALRLSRADLTQRELAEPRRERCGSFARRAKRISRHNARSRPADP